MAKKVNLPYDPAGKEPWHIEFENEPVDDDFWSCIVTAAVPAEQSESRFIDAFNGVAETGTKRAIRTITVADVVKTLKSADKKVSKENKKEAKKTLEPPPPRSNEIVILCSKYASFGEGGCKLPPDLMAAVIKYLILNIKDDDCFKRRINNAINKKLKEAELKKEIMREHLKDRGRILENPCRGRIFPSDEPVGGPQVYVMLSGFFDPACFPELIRLKVNFLALIRVERSREISPKAEKESPPQERKKSTVSSFWEEIKNELENPKTTSLYKDIALLKYEVSHTDNFESEEAARNAVFHDLSQIQYCTFFIYKHHQNYLQQLRVHPAVECSEPLDLKLCTIYNKLCDYFSPGEDGDEFLILYSIVEQVVAGIPETGPYNKIEYALPETDFFGDSSDVDFDEKESEEKILLTTPCKKCREKFCRKHGTEDDVRESEKENSISDVESGPKTSEFRFSVDAIEEALVEKKEKEESKNKRWKSPKLFARDDAVSIRCADFDLKIIDPSSVVKRFFFDSMIPVLWAKYPELPPADRTYYDYQLHRLLEVSNENEESLRLKVHFMIVMNMIAFAGSSVHKGDDDNESQLWEVRSSKFSLPPVLSDEKFRRSSGEAVWGQVSETDFWRTFFKKIYDFPFDEGERSKAVEIGLGIRRETEDCMLRKVASVSDLFKPCEIPMSKLYNEDKFSQPDLVEKGSSEEIFQVEADQLWKLFECPDISSLEDPIFLTDFAGFQDFAKRYNAYEELNPASMVQRLRSASDAYNMVQFNYFAPSDSLILLVYNDCDYRGMYFDTDYGSLPTPVSLRDFYSFVFFEVKDWLKVEDQKYQEYVLRKKEKEKRWEKRKEEEILRSMKKEFLKMKEEEKADYLGIGKESKKPGKKEEKKGEEWTLTEEDLEALPKREKFKKPNRKSFDVTNLADVRVQVNTKNVQFHSRDGTYVDVTAMTWLYDSNRSIRLKTKKNKVEIKYHYYADRPLDKNFEISTESGVRIFFFAEPERKNFHYFMKATWPSGLVVETKLSPDLYVKQSYVDDKASDESSRCFLKESKVLIFRKNGNVDVFCSDGTKYGCYEFEISKNSEDAEDRVPIEIYDYDVLTPTGEMFSKPSRPKGSKAIKHVDTLKVLIGEDKENEEIFYRREDGTNCMLWPDGKLVTTYKDGTKITLAPEFEEEEIVTEWTDEERLYFLRLEAERSDERRNTSTSVRSILRTSAEGKFKRSDSSRSGPDDFKSEGFASVETSCLMEHPKYSTVFYSSRGDDYRIDMPGVEIRIRPNGTYRIEFGKDSIANVSENRVETFQECSDCNKKSSAAIDFSCDENPDSILSKTVDFFGRIFVLKRNGETVVDSGTGDDSGFNRSETETLKPEDGSRCDHDLSVGSKRRLFALDRDSSGVEFLHDDVLASALRNRSCEIESKDDCRHFYESLGFEKWKMSYGTQDSFPTALKRKDLTLLGSKINGRRKYEYPFPRESSPTADKTFLYLRSKEFEIPEAVAIRIVKFLKPDPVEILDRMVAIVKSYQNRSKQSVAAYKEHYAADDTSQDERHVQMRLKKIALTLNQSLKLFDHSGIVTPSTDRDFHVLAHKREINECMSDYDDDFLPDCKNIKNALAKLKRKSVISEITERHSN